MKGKGKGTCAVYMHADSMYCGNRDDDQADTRIVQCDDKLAFGGGDVDNVEHWSDPVRKARGNCDLRPVKRETLPPQKEPT